MTPRFIHRRHRSNFRYGAVAGFLLCIGVLAACHSQQRVIARHEDTLAISGFTRRPADTPELRTLLNRLPAHRIVQRLRGDTIRYVYADPEVCDCLYLGSQRAYDQYRQIRQRARVANGLHMAASTYSGAT